MMSEILCHTHPDDCMVWNRRAFVAFRYLAVPDLPRYDYQMTGAKYVYLSKTARAIREELRKKGIKDANLLTVDYFIWDELQVEDNLSNIFGAGADADKSAPAELKDVKDASTAEFIHDEVRDKIADIGRWLGLSARIETKVADGSIVDAVWESTIGNMEALLTSLRCRRKGR